jgi:hypothetical protein
MFSSSQGQFAAQYGGNVPGYGYVTSSQAQFAMKYGGSVGNGHMTSWDAQQAFGRK